MEKPFSKLSAVESPVGLKLRALEGIEAARKKASVKRVIGFGILELASVATAVSSFAYIFGSLKTSGMSEYLSLVFTDGITALAYSKELALSVLEALPALSIAIALAACVACAWSTMRLIRISKSPTQYA